MVESISNEAKITSMKYNERVRMISYNTNSYIIEFQHLRWDIKYIAILVLIWNSIPITRLKK